MAPLLGSSEGWCEQLNSWRSQPSGSSFRPTGAPRINSDQVASDTRDSTIGGFYMTVKLLFWKANRDRNRELS